jgi:hypothetical protein
MDAGTNLPSPFFQFIHGMILNSSFGVNPIFADTALTGIDGF